MDGADRPTPSRDAVADAAGADLRLWGLVRATPLLTWALVAIFGLLGVAYAIAVPLLHGPDEGAHVDRIAGFDLAGQFTVDPRGDLRYSPDLLAAYPEVNIDPVDHRVLPVIPWRPLNTADATPVDQRPPYADLAPHGRADERFVNAARSHPPGYYAAVDALDAVVTSLGVPALDEAGWDTTIARWRLWSAFLLLPIPWVAFWLAARIVVTAPGRRSGRGERGPSARRAGFVAAALTLAAPQLSHSAGTVNNDALLFTGTSLAALAVTWLATGDMTWRTAAWAGVGRGVAVFSKVFGFGAPVWIAAALLIGSAAWSHRLRLLGVAAAATVAAGGWFTLATLVRHRTVAPRGFAYEQPDDLVVRVGPWLREVAERLTSTGFGRLGVEQFGIPGWSVWLATLALLGLVAVAITGPSTRRRLPLVGVLLIPFLTTLAMVLWAAWGGYARSGVPSGLHGRYLFVGAPGLAALASLGLHDLVGRRDAAPPWLPFAITGAAVALLQGLGLVTALANWWPGGWSDRVRTAMLFSGWSDPALAVLAVLGIVAVGALGVGARRQLAAPLAPGAPRAEVPA